MASRMLVIEVGELSSRRLIPCHRRPLGRGAPITAPSFFRRSAGRPGSPNRRAPSLIVSIVRIEPQPTDRSQGARRRPPGVRNRPGRRWHRPSTRHRAAPKGFEGAIRSTPYGAALASGVTVQESHDQPPRVRIGMVFPVRQEFTIAVADRRGFGVRRAIDENSLCQSYHLHRQPSSTPPKAVQSDLR